MLHEDYRRNATGRICKRALAQYKRGYFEFVTNEPPKVRSRRSIIFRGSDRHRSTSGCWPLHSVGRSSEIADRTGSTFRSPRHCDPNRKPRMAMCFGPVRHLPSPDVRPSSKQSGCRRFRFPERSSVGRVVRPRPANRPSGCLSPETSPQWGFRQRSPVSDPVRAVVPKPNATVSRESCGYLHRIVP